MWAVLLSLLCVTVAKPYEGELFDSRSFFEDDESVIQSKAPFQYMNKAKENMNTLQVIVKPLQAMLCTLCAIRGML